MHKYEPWLELGITELEYYKSRWIRAAAHHYREGVEDAAQVVETVTKNFRGLGGSEDIAESLDAIYASIVGLLVEDE